jgi:hypothetical protein
VTDDRADLQYRISLLEEALDRRMRLGAGNLAMAGACWDTGEEMAMGAEVFRDKEIYALLDESFARVKSQIKSPVTVVQEVTALAVRVAALETEHKAGSRSRRLRIR